MLLFLIYALSGAAALMYEVAWTRQIADALGASTQTVSAVLGGFMGGLAVGAIAGRRRLAQLPPLRTYGVIQLAVGAIGVLMPIVIPTLGELAGSVPMAVRCALACGLVFVPAVLMGATFPLMVAAARQMATALYAVNTFGAIAGTLIAAFGTIGTLGLRATSFIAASIDIFVGLVAIVLARRVLVAERRDAPIAPAIAKAGDGRFLLGVFASGAVALGCEVLWMRMFSAVFISTVYSLALILATFLAAPAIAASASRLIARRAAAPEALPARVLLAGAVAVVAGLLVFPATTTTAGASSLAFGGPSFASYVCSFVLDAAKVMFVPALLLGAVLPLTMAVLERTRSENVRIHPGVVFGVNSLGAVVGSLVTGFILIPLLGNFALVAMTLAATAAVLGFAAHGGAGSKRWRDAGIAFLCCGILLSVAPRTPRDLLERGTMMSAGEVLHYEDGSTLTVTVTQDKKGVRTLYTDSFAVAGTGETAEYMHLLGHLPMMLAPSSKSACVIGLGTGTTAGALLRWPLQKIEVVELCPEVARAADHFADVNNDLMAKLGRDPRLSLVLDDGRARLRAGGEPFDVIIAEPINPHMAWATLLYAREFYVAARARLSAGGSLTQWFPFQGVKPEHFRALIATLLDVFPKSCAWYFHDSILVVGFNEDSGAPLVIDHEALAAATAIGEVAQELPRLHLPNAGTILGSFLCGPSALKAWTLGARIVTDDVPQTEYFEFGTPVGFTEGANLGALARIREPVLPYLTTGASPPAALARDFSRRFEARGLAVEARLYEIDVAIGKAAGMSREAATASQQAKAYLERASIIAPDDGYIARALDRYR